MRIKWIDRLLSAVSGLVLLFLSFCCVVVGIDRFFSRLSILDAVKGLLIEEPPLMQQLVILGIAVVLFGLGIHGLSLLFRKRKDRGFVIQHTEMGDMSISMHAMEGMVKRCIDTHEELKVTHTRIHRVKDGVAVDIRVSLANGVNIPLTVNALQKQIKHYITSCSGIDVKVVRVMVETDNHQKPKSAEVVAPDLAAAEASAIAQPVQMPDSFDSRAEADKEPVHQRIFKVEEQEQTVPPPPEAEMPMVEIVLNDEAATEEFGGGARSGMEAVADEPSDAGQAEDSAAEEEDVFQGEDAHFENLLVKEHEDEKENE